MKIPPYIFLLTLFPLVSCSPKYDVVRKEVYKGITPPNCVWLRDSLYIDQTEIANIHYREYLYWLEKEFGYFSDEFARALPDTSCWQNTLIYCGPYMAYYLRHPAYQNYPVVGITVEQAEQFCVWRSHMVNEMIYRTQNDIDVSWDSTLYFKENINFRLPTPEEWEYAASAGLDINNFPFGYETTRDKKGYLKFHYDTDSIPMYTNKASRFNCYSILTAPVYSFAPNKYGIYNIIGNVAELTEKTNVAKGGSFIHHLDSCKVSQDISYSRPEAWLGFRCAAEVINDTLYSENYHRYNWLRNDTLKIPITPSKEQYDINISEFHCVKKLSDVILLNPDDTILSYRVTVTPLTGRALRDSVWVYNTTDGIADSTYTLRYIGKPNTPIFNDRAYNDYFNDYVTEAFNKINLGAIISISEIRIKRNNRQLVYNGIRIRIVG